VRDKWLGLVRRVEQRIALPSTRYVFVTGPSGSSLDDAAHLVGELCECSLAASAVLLNRAVGAAPPWLDALGNRVSAEPSLGDALDAYRSALTLHPSSPTTWPCSIQTYSSTKCRSALLGPVTSTRHSP
jgi:hypothetical protein